MKLTINEDNKMVKTKIETTYGEFELGQDVWVVQKTKQRPAKIIKLNDKKAVIEMEGKQYRCPYSMLHKEAFESRMDMDDYHHEMNVQRWEAQQN